MSVTGRLLRVAGIGGESTGWAIHLKSSIEVDGKQVDSIEIAYTRTAKLEKLGNRRVVGVGMLTHRHGVETGDRPVLELTSLKRVRKSVTTPS